MLEQYNKAFQLVGIKTRTTNQEEMSGAGRIGSLWQRFYSEQVMAKVANKIGEDVVSVYCEYESDASGPYSVFVGVQVSEGTAVPAGLEVLKVPAQKYSLIQSEMGAMPGVVIGAWQKVWQAEQQGALKRAYSFDLEVYGPKAQNPQSAQVDLLIAVK